MEESNGALFRLIIKELVKSERTVSVLDKELAALKERAGKLTELLNDAKEGE